MCVASVDNLLTVSRAGGLLVLAVPEDDVRGQDPASGGVNGEPRPQPGLQSGAARTPPHPGNQERKNLVVLHYFLKH